MSDVRNKAIVSDSLLSAKELDGCRGRIATFLHRTPRPDSMALPLWHR